MKWGHVVSAVCGTLAIIIATIVFDDVAHATRAYAIAAALFSAACYFKIKG